MGVSLETRMPLLDHRVVEFAWSLPQSMKIRDGETKWPLRRLLERYVPPGLTERPKSGFAIPVGDWIRGPLRDWAEDLLAPERLARESYLVPDLVRQQWSRFRDHDEGSVDAIWPILMFQAWLAATADIAPCQAKAG
jgi:asparagine synthase (glutamine-hydrolysing)